jgi:hypothetical protein
MRSTALESPEQENPEGKSVRKPPAFAVTATPPGGQAQPPPPSDPPPGLQGGGKDGKPTMQHATAPADATHAHMRGPTVIHPEVETEGVTITADNVAPADRKAWKYLGQEGISYYYFCEWKGVAYFITTSSVNSGEDIYHYAEAKPDGEWKLFYPDMPPDFMGDLQRTVALHYDMLEWAKIIVLETAMFLLLEEVSLARFAGRFGMGIWRAWRNAGRRVGRSVGKKAGKKAAKKATEEAVEQSAESTSAEAAETVADQTAKAVAKKEMRSYTQSNFRHNLQVLTNEEGMGMDAHHVFPKKFVFKFDDAGINIHDPRYGAWWERSSHKATANSYNQAWEEFFEFGKSQAEILEKGRTLMKSHNIQINF